jgi:hypothetical protein
MTCDQCRQSSPLRQATARAVLVCFRGSSISVPSCPGMRPEARAYANAREEGMKVPGHDKRPRNSRWRLFLWLYATVPLANCIFNRADPHSWRGRMIFGKPCRERFRFALQNSFIALVMDARLIFSNDELLRCRSSRRPGKIDLLTRSRFRRKAGISRGDRSDNSRRRHQFAEPFRQ